MLVLVMYTVKGTQSLCHYIVWWFDSLGAGPNIVSWSPWKFEDANPFVNNIDDICAKASEILATSLWHTETSVRENKRWENEGKMHQYYAYYH